MNKDTFYFPHDYEPTSDPKIQALLGEYGGLGYGVYWRVIEMLHSDSNHKLPLKQYVFLAIAKQMLASAEQILAIINFAAKQCELFVSDDEFIWSRRVNDNILKREEISQKRAISGRLGASKKHSLANASKCLAKSSKGKERKRKEYICVIPSVEEISNYCHERNNNINAQSFFDFYQSKGWMIGKNKMKDWKAAVRTWEKNNHNTKSEDKPSW